MRFHAALASLMLVLSACASDPAPEAAPAKSASAEAPLVTETRAVVQAYVDKDQFSGTVMVAKDGKPVFREGFSLANRELNAPNTGDTVFRLGSITKQFTAVSILQLAEAGKLNIEDPISKYYTNAPAAWSKVTLRHLLSHRSGIGDYTGLPNFFEKLAVEDRTPEQIIDMTRDAPLAFEPGSKFSYNNSGYVVLGYVIEKVSGETYADYVSNHIFKPLGMKHSGYEVITEIVPNRAAGYSVANGQWTNATYIAMTLPYAAGSLYSTVDDLLIWEDALFSNKVISAASLKAMTTDQGDKYAFGLLIDDLGGHKNIWHNGGINGFSTHMNRFVDDGVTVVVLSNLESGRSGRIATEVSRLWLGIPAPPPPPELKPVTVAPEILDKYVGVYELMPGFNITITRGGQSLIGQATGQGDFQLTATSDIEFQQQQAGIRIVFPVGDGPAQSFTLFQGGERVAKRIAAN